MMCVSFYCHSDQSLYTAIDQSRLKVCASPLHFAGSEPSLASKNGHRSSTTASKRTLASQENFTTSSIKSQPQALQTSATPNPNDLMDRSSCQSALPLVETRALPNKDMVDNASPKTPSYLKLSCALGGYRYNSYASPKAQNRHNFNQNSEDELDNENVIPNGHVDPVTSPATPAKIKVAEASKGPNRAMVKMTPNGATVTRLSNGEVNYPPIQPKPVIYTARTSSQSDSRSSPTVTALPVVNGSNSNRTPADVGNSGTASQCSSSGRVLGDAKEEVVTVNDGFATPEQSRDSDSDTPTPSKVCIEKCAAYHKNSTVVLTTVCSSNQCEICFVVQILTNLVLCVCDRMGNTSCWLWTVRRPDLLLCVTLQSRTYAQTSLKMVSSGLCFSAVPFGTQ